MLITSFDNAQLAANYQDQLRYWRRRYSAGALFDASWRRLRDFWRFFIGPLLSPALLFAGAIWKKRSSRVWLGVSLAFVVDHATFHAWYPQQSAPETVLIVLFLVCGWRQVRAWRRSSGFGLAFSRNVLGGYVLALALLGTGVVLNRFSPGMLSGQHSVLASLVSTPSARERVIRDLEQIPGKHLVFVRYGQGHPWYDEWVFNGADIPGSRIVFARLRTAQSDAALAQTLTGRSIWIADADAASPLKRLTQEQLLTRDNDSESRIADSREGQRTSNGTN